MSMRTHEVFNQFEELQGYNLYATDAALQDALKRANAGWAEPLLKRYGAEIGSREAYAQADEANRHPPELRSFDARGRRIDTVDFHPSWHATMARLRNAGFVSLPFSDSRAGRWAAMNAGFYLHSQVESG
jgi:putative acyl-CoA dehydrogenase